MITSLALLVGSAGTLPAQGTRAAAQEHAEKGLQFAQSGDLARAEAELREAGKLAPDDPSYLTSLGGILGMEQKFQEANVYFERAVKIDPSYAAARRNLAANEWRLGQLKQAQDNLERLLRAEPQDRVAKLLLGMVSENQHEYVRAAELLAAVPDLVQQRPEAVAALAGAYYHTERREQARQLLESLLAQPVSPEGVFAAAGVAAQSHDYPIAERLFASIRSTYPDTTALEFNLALIEFHTGRIVESQNMLQKLVNTGTSKAEIYNLQGMVEMKLNRFTDAVRAYSKAVELEPRSLDPKIGLASAKWAAGMRAEAESEFQALLKQHPHDAGVCESYGTALLNSATDDATLARAAELLRKAVELDSSRAEAHYELGVLELKRDTASASPDRLRDALEQLQTSVRLGLNGSQVHYALARVYRRLGHESEAANEMQLYQQALGGMQDK